jgi:signal transduction histidine kinase
VADVTELARGQPVTSAPGDVRLDEVAAAALEGARRDWPRTPFTADLEPCVVAGCAQRLQIAVRNLLENAAKFGPPGAPVEVGMLAGELTVRDHGPGIPPADLPGVFDRAASARGVPGSGLGLAVVRQVAESHGGTVRAEPAPGGGTLIRLRLTGPTSRASAAQAAPLPPRCRSLDTRVAGDRGRTARLRPVAAPVAASRNRAGSASRGREWPLATMTGTRLVGDC